MQSLILPNNLKIYAPNRIEARALYREIFAERTYSSHGISVSDGDCVFDVGANIGLYSIFLTQSHRDLRIIAFEPIPQTFSILKKNIDGSPNGSQVKLFNFGLSNKSGRSLFEFDRFASLAATMRPDDVNGCIRKDAGMREWARAGISDLRKIDVLSPRLADYLLTALSRPFAGALVAAVMISFLFLSLFRRRLFLQKIECELKTISEVIREQRLATIALLKIDVEGSELDVIEGIAEEDWPRIRQCVVEVHDYEGRVQRMKAIFESRGYRTIVSQEDWEAHKLINTFTIYAVRV
ncbi:MAG: FkbM family methyltransferase [Acidobacteria bacterium]|nr:FkbM family methyltransferase [Acidobacteriota bacterium]